MLRPLTLALLAAFAFGCDDDDDTQAPADAAVQADGSQTADSTPDSTQAPSVTLTAGPDFVAGEVPVEVSAQGASRVELIVNGQVAASATPDEAGAATLTWATTGQVDGPVTVIARAINGELHSDSAAWTPTVDNTAPTAAITTPALTALSGEDLVELSVADDNLAGFKLLAGEQVLAELPRGAGVRVDTTDLPDGLAELVVEARDQAGNVTRSAVTPVVILNKAEELPLSYDPAPEAHVPANYQTAEYHTRGQVTAPEGVKRILAWMTWDASAGWRFDLALGQGLCPHRGISYTTAEGDHGAIFIDLPREDLSAAALARLPEAERTSSTFPYNTDPETFGVFFAHADPLDPADHVDQSLPIELHIAVFR